MGRGSAKTRAISGPQTSRSTRVSSHPTTERVMFLGSRLVGSDLCACRQFWKVYGLTGCAVKGGGPQRELDPSGNWFAPPGSNQSSSGGNETAEASGAESR